MITASLKQIYQADAEGTPAAAPVSPGHWLVRYHHSPYFAAVLCHEAQRALAAVL